MLDLNAAAAEAAALMKPFVQRVNPELGGSLWFQGQPVALLAAGGETAGQYALLDTVLMRGSELPPHLHQREDEAYYLLEGQMTFTVGNVTIPARPGEFVFLPRGIVHSYRVETEQCRTLVLLTPAGLEDFICKIGIPMADDSVPQGDLSDGFSRLAAASQDYGLEWVSYPVPAENARHHYDLEAFTPGVQGSPCSMNSLTDGEGAGFPMMTVTSSPV